MQLIQSLEQMKGLEHPHGSKLGFVPTMGYLHEGHLSLVERAKQDNDITVVSIFVNPAQFGPNEDLQTYPRDLERDLALLEERGVNYVFSPDDAIMYPPGYLTWVEVEKLSTILCGASRPGHFRGVCTVVLKLINIIKPHRMYMGEKDFQQLIILRKMVEDLNLDVQIIGCPIVREDDGLAKSSRNVYLDADQRKNAVAIYQAMLHASRQVAAGQRQAHELVTEITDRLISAGAKPDYVKIVNSKDLSDVDHVGQDSRIMVAAWFGKTRLIDNMPLIT
nr:pantoate--beta-alanine ligase [Candidatus Cloacimonadota bacterium]